MFATFGRRSTFYLLYLQYEKSVHWVYCERGAAQRSWDQEHP